MTYRILLVFTLFLSSMVMSQEASQNFSLQEAIDFALENNRQVKNATLDIEAAKKQKWETTATGLPQINASIDYQNFLKQQVSLIPAEFFGGNPGEFAEVTFGTKQSASAFATVTQKIFDGSYLVGLQSAKVYLEISENAKEKTDLEVRKAVINAYGNVLLAEESVDILQRNIAVIRKNVEETTKVYENGMAEEESVEQLQITLSLLESSLSNTERLKTLAYQMFNITIGLDLTANTELTDSLETLTIQNMDLKLLDAEENIENTIDFKIAENDKVSKELLLKLAKSRALPTVDAFINGGYSGYNESFKFLNKDQDWFGSSLFGVSMNIPIFSSLERSAAIQRAQINLEKAETDLELVEQQLSFEITTAKSNYQYAIEEYQNKKQNLNLAERIEQKNQTKFFEGIGSSFDLRQAQTQLYTAQREYLESMFNVISTKAELETVLNTVQLN
ncbi:MAG TPA: TolC family protein [Flavobacteriaceae bacterium]|nr:TolC family protein [Flavobacteriaceae bacterium]